MKIRKGIEQRVEQKRGLGDPPVFVGVLCLILPDITLMLRIKFTI